MYIEPNSVFYILKNVPLDTTYDHTIYFSTELAQRQYFAGRAKYILHQQSYQRINSGKMRIERVADLLYDCNYIMFQNTAFGDKFFYAFIKSVEYVNNNVSEVTFEIDVIQTWMFDYTLDDCFVEREHSATDNLYEHIEAENIEIGDEYKVLSQSNFDMNEMYVCILLSKQENQAGYQGSTIHNIYTPLRVTAGIPATDASTLNAIINGIVEDGQEDRIVAIYQYPKILGDASTTDLPTFTFPLQAPTAIDGYVPKNKKLFSYPYSAVLVSNNLGQVSTLRWEDWEEGDYFGQFKIAGTFLTTPCVMCYPYRYRGLINDYDSGITISSFPQCAWVGDAFKAWWAQNRAAVATSGISTALTAGVAVFALSNPATAAYGAGALVSVANNVSSTLARVSDLKNVPPQVHGHTQTESLNAGLGRFRFSFYTLSIKSQYAKIVDDYFTRYGYATKRNKKPNRNVRPHWTFCKTIGCTISGSIPSDDAKKICQIYDNGITWWNHASEVGNYSLDNSPV